MKPGVRNFASFVAGLSPRLVADLGTPSSLLSVELCVDLRSRFLTSLRSLAMEEPVKLKFLDVISEKLHSGAALNILYMAWTEINTVLEMEYNIRFDIHALVVFISPCLMFLDREVLFRRAEDLYFIYGHDDPYTPLSYPEEIKAQFPGGTPFSPPSSFFRLRFCSILHCLWPI